MSTMNKEEMAEDFCFICKDGGHLRLCDYKDCLKAYHPSCVDKNDSFLETERRWTCRWHSCHCRKSATYQCYCCPHSFCQACIRKGKGEFVQVKNKTKGFCRSCLKLAILIEENIDVDSDGAFFLCHHPGSSFGENWRFPACFEFEQEVMICHFASKNDPEEKVDFADTETYEFLFKDYWEIVKDQEGLTLVDLRAANALLKSGQNCGDGSDSDVLPEEDKVPEADDLDERCSDEISLFGDMTLKNDRAKRSMKRSNSKKKNFIGWGSEQLIGFLQSIGKDTEKALSQLEVDDIIKSYIRENNLLDPNKKKKKVLCNEKLHFLFKKRSVKFQKIYSLLEAHFRANYSSESSFSSEDGDDLVVRKRQRVKLPEPRVQESIVGHQEGNVSESLKSRYASIVDKNIQPIYLRRTLILEFLKNPETFENKVIGCFVRVKNDRNDFYYSPLKVYQLGQVTGVKKASHVYKVGESSTDVLLRISNIFKDVQISMLSEDDIEEEEYEDLRQLAKKGRFKRPTVAEVDEKIRTVHGDITNHWIDKEIGKLQMRIERANEKGWRRELFEYIERKKQLCEPAERMRLLKEIPKAIADTVEEIKATENVATDLHADKTGFKADLPEDATEAKCSLLKPEGSDDSYHEIFAEGKFEGSDDSYHEIFAEGKFEGNGANANEGTTGEDAEGETSSGLAVQYATDSVETNGNCKHKLSTVILKHSEGQTNIKSSEIQIINIDDDEEDDFPKKGSKENKPGLVDISVVSSGKASPENEKVWHYLDPTGKVQGPFPLAALRCWMDYGYFDDDFRVWRTGQAREEAIRLIDALQLTSL